MTLIEDWSHVDYIVAFYQLYVLTFWRHPIHWKVSTGEQVLLNFLQIGSDEENTYILDGLKVYPFI